MEQCHHVLGLPDLEVIFTSIGVLTNLDRRFRAIKAECNMLEFTSYYGMPDEASKILVVNQPHILSPCSNRERIKLREVRERCDFDCVVKTG